MGSHAKPKVQGAVILGALCCCLRSVDTEIFPERTPVAVSEVDAAAPELRDPLMLGDPPAATGVDAAGLLNHQLQVDHHGRVQGDACVSV